MGGDATRDRYPSVHACLTRFETLPNYITTARGKSAREKGYPKLSLLSLSLSLSLFLFLKRPRRDCRFACRAFVPSATDIDYCKPNLVVHSIFSSVFHHRCPEERHAKKHFLPRCFSRVRFCGIPNPVLPSFPRVKRNLDLFHVDLSLYPFIWLFRFSVAHSVGFDLDPPLKFGRSMKQPLF